MSNEPSQQTDDDLVRAYLSGQQQAFEELYQRHAQKLLGFLAGEVGRVWAEDLVQETFSRLLTSLHRYDARGHFSAYLYRIGLNLARDSQRKYKPTSPLEAAEWLLATLTLDHELDRTWLLSALKGLSREQKQVVLLHEYVGMTFSEIATTFQRPLGTVLSQMHRALAGMRRQLAPEAT